jgi:thioesterase III
MKTTPPALCAASKSLSHKHKGKQTMIHCCNIRIRGYHLDFYGHVNNTRYLEFLEEARWELFENRVDIKALQKEQIAFLVVNININYRTPARLGDTLTLGATLKKVGTKSAVLFQEVRLKKTDKIVADAEVTFVLSDTKTGKAVPLTGNFEALLKNLVV